jgi:hypothetical protein
MHKENYVVKVAYKTTTVSSLSLGSEHVNKQVDLQIWTRVTTDILPLFHLANQAIVGIKIGNCIVVIIIIYYYYLCTASVFL